MYVSHRSLYTLFQYYVYSKTYVCVCARARASTLVCLQFSSSRGFLRAYHIENYRIIPGYST